MVEQNMPRKNGTPINANSLPSDEEASENMYSESIGDEEVEDEDMPSGEFQDLDEQLNALSKALDLIETKNSNLQAELLRLLQSSQETRKQLNDIHHESMHYEDDTSTTTFENN